MSITRDTVLAALSRVHDPVGGGDIVARGMVSDVFIDGGKVVFALTVPAASAQKMEPLRAAAQQAVEALDGVEKAMVALTAERTGGSPAPDGPVGSPVVAKPGHRHKPEASARLPKKAPVPGIDHIIAVASGKGGVGKSTTSVNLALALAARGLNVGVLDADIYGPSMPRLLGTAERPTALDDKTMTPIDAHGLKVMSMGFLVDEGAPVVWRGPMVISALTQMLREVAWGKLDVLVVDMPPGTGDAQLTMAQQVPLSGAVIVSTPQDLALIDARKGMAMFAKVDVPLLGIVENMSTFACPKCGEVTEIFGHGGAREEADKSGVPFLGAVPLAIDIRTHSDAGTPIVTSEPDGPHAEAYRGIAAMVAERLGI